MFTAALFTIARHENNLCSSTDDWIKMWYIYIMEYYSAIKRNEIMPFSSTRIDLELIIPSGINQKEKD